MEYKRLISVLLLTSGLLFSCQEVPKSPSHAKKVISVTYSVLGALVKDLVGEEFTVKVLIPNGLDVHEWEPSAKDMETLFSSSLIVENGLGLEGGLSKTLEQARNSGIPIFTASDHINVRRVGKGEGIPSEDPDQALGAQDPHLWTDPLTLKSILQALGDQLEITFKIDLKNQKAALSHRLTILDSSLRSQVELIPENQRNLVTGHESLGYFAQAYGFKLVGAIIPSLNTQAEVSAAEMAKLKVLIQENQVKVIFTEIGTPPKVAQALAQDAGVKTVEIHTHLVPPDGSYFTLMSELATAITQSLK